MLLTKRLLPSDESSDDDFKPKPKKESLANAKKTAAPRKKAAPKEVRAAAMKPSKPKVKRRKKLGSDVDLSLSDNDAPHPNLHVNLVAVGGRN
ncbi:hypothetical protein AVEN_66975-1 [Araneus ventricosus]|uniref:Uncharacterized protein n=1 Tax=Araneus ventricosus TaxID=182803 RepID=A0A4Y2P0M7_ARAVE|nr:hypothetical protein AVEN_66975-1 [Araneus ventricosus]